MASPSQVETNNIPVYAAAPLPPGWTEHRAPTGQFYYYHAASGESTYVRPSIQIIPANSDHSSNNSNGNTTQSNKVADKKASTSKRKEKPKIKEPIPETDWMKVTTTEGNVFYTNLETKVSSWTVPDEIKAQVQCYEEQEFRKKEELKRVEEEQARIKAEEVKRAHEAEQKRLIELEVQKVRAEVEAEAVLRGLKRKTEDQSHLATTSSVQPQASTSSVSHIDVGTTLDERKTKSAKLELKDEDQDEEWQRQIAEEMALEASEESNTTNATLIGNSSTLGAPGPAPASGLSPEELKAMFKAMLLEKDINPMAPWDNELPKFVMDSRYLAVSSMKERRDLFDEFCKEKIRQQRAAKVAALKVDPPQAYRSLLIEFVTSTRMLWEDFKTKHKKDARFRNFGRDDREREKAFKGWLKELGEQKRQQLIRSEEQFLKLLEEKVDTADEWEDVKEKIKNEPRYLGISSNSMKESLWKKWREQKTGS
ncbi:hypothetical protein O181_089302 [Austropuccinia psidii MF-1]|uniref:WW domain-containing protein n=1 Tax=Austropuccinia psidii MF-1 TaxID=1389203 RepID=A0A9Q3ITB9_9BASI|nr:hypothetical protein [Austropuccinia psidii MF-1]